MSLYLLADVNLLFCKISNLNSVYLSTQVQFLCYFLLHGCVWVSARIYLPSSWGRHDTTPNLGITALNTHICIMKYIANVILHFLLYVKYVKNVK